MHQVALLMKEAVADGVFPGGVLLVVHEGRTVFCGAYGKANIYSGRDVRPETFFDLASLTKPLATALAVLILVQEERLGLRQPLGEILPGLASRDTGRATICDLLAHRAGLPAHRPYFKEVVHTAPKMRRQALNRLLAREPLKTSPGAETLYSDLGFMFLRWAVEEVTGLRMDRFVEGRIYRPLGLDLFFIDLAAPHRQREFAATEICPWRGFLLQGQVHDENAWAVGGVDGQSGLFGSAAALGGLLSELMAVFGGNRGAGLFDPQTVRTFFRPAAEGGRALGFDIPSPEGSSSGRRFSTRTIGHLGFTGTSFWVDLDRMVAVILLTNRIHPSRKNDRIRAFRPRIHDAVMGALSF